MNIRQRTRLFYTQMCKQIIVSWVELLVAPNVENVLTPVLFAWITVIDNGFENSLDQAKVNQVYIEIQN